MSENKALHKCTIAGTEYTFQRLAFKNGAFIAISDTEPPRIGGLTVALSAGSRVDVNTVIPLKTGYMPQRIMSELLAKEIGGIVILTFNMEKGLDAEEARTLIDEVRRWLKN